MRDFEAAIRPIWDKLVEDERDEAAYVAAVCKIIGRDRVIGFAERQPA